MRGTQSFAIRRYLNYHGKELKLMTRNRQILASSIRIALAGFAFAILVSSTAFSQKAGYAEITGLYGYTFAEGFDLNSSGGGHVSLSDGAVYGGILAYVANPMYEVEVKYIRQDGHADVRSFYINQNNVSYGLNYIELGGSRLQPFGEYGSAGYGGFDVGAAIFDPDTYQSTTKFAFGIHMGVKYFMNERIGIRLQGDLQMPFMYAGGSIFVGSGGASAGVSASGVITQMQFHGGVILRLGGD
jgi:hypothetical protein